MASLLTREEEEEERRLLKMEAITRRCKESWGRLVLSKSRSRGVCWLATLMGWAAVTATSSFPIGGDAVHHVFTSDPSWMLRWSREEKKFKNLNDQKEEQEEMQCKKQRGMYSAASLDRSGSFRESIENRTLNPGPAQSRGSGGALSGEIPSLSQYMSLEQMSLGEQKYTRTGELRRALNVSLGATSEEHLYIQSNKPIPPVSSEELKRFKASVFESSARARDRVKLLNDYISKLDKYRQTILSRKRPRNDIQPSERSGGVNLSKIGSHAHQNPPDILGQRLDDRAKSAVPNKRARSSVAEVRSEGRTTALSRQAAVMDKDKNMLRPPVLVEDKIRGLPAGGDGWDKKMKRKRSVGAVVSRSADGERELKQVVQQRLTNETRSRPCDGPGFRSGSSNGIIGINKLDGSSQPNVSNVRSMPRNDLEGISIPCDRRDAGLEKERLVPRGTKMSVREDGQAGSPGPMTKGKGSRAPRSGSSLVANTTSNISRTSGALDAWEQPPCLSKVQPLIGPNNRKRPMPTGSSSPPVTQWGGQRPQKSSRTRRTNLVSPVSNQEDPQMLHDEFPVPEAGPKLPPVEGSGPLLSRVMSAGASQYRLKLDNAPSPAGPSESEESGAAEMKSKEKGVENGEDDDGTVNEVQKAASFLLPTKKNKLIKEDIGDGVRRQGRSGRVSAQGRTCLPLAREKLEKTAMTKPLRSGRPEKGESKVGRPPSKKASDRKTFHRIGVIGNSGSSEFIGESEDDREELLEAATSAWNASYDACFGLFWKNMEPYFSFLSSDDMTHLKQQGELVHNITDSSLVSLSGERQVSQANAAAQGGLNMSAKIICLDGESQRVDKLDGRLGTERLFEKIIPLSQRLLAAFIIEDEMDEVDHKMEQRDTYMHFTVDESSYGMSSHVERGPKESYRIDSELELEFDPRVQKSCSCNGSTTSNSFRSPLQNLLYNNEQWQENDVSVNSEFGNGSGLSQDNIHRAQPVAMNSPGICSHECQYQQMSLDERIMMELHSIGLFPDAVPDLAEGDDDDEISKEITELKLRLYHQVRKMKEPLSKLEDSIKGRRELEERNLEQLAIRILVDMAYKKLMACRGHKGGVNKASKQVALAFAKRTLERCRRYEDAGGSCFTEPVFRDAMFSVPLQSGETNCIDGISTKTPANPYTDAHSFQMQSWPSAAGHVSDLVDRNGLTNPKSERGLLDASQVLTHLSDQTFSKYESIPNRGKKREVLLDDVVGNAGPRITSTLANALSGGAKGKRSDRERDQNKDLSTRNPLAKAGRPSLSGSGRGERKAKSKPKQKTAQLSASAHGLLVKPQESTDSVLQTARTVSNCDSKMNLEVGVSGSNSVAQDLSKQNEESLDFSSLLNGSDDIVGQNQDLDTWLNVDVDGMQDCELAGGLDIPMDDLTQLKFF
ncbi:hypothetical protein QJS04_geneDACA008488 [Acorus gramineus]|uniref:Uncharacterized protein n=1 Tax=Acorus gramineus TaxID=55184 RepID=A0AAV9AH52_ACOGR|nr:hypothetical protein QJS04_geneDACA008488 [Acorus gramineus]